MNRNTTSTILTVVHHIEQLQTVVNYYYSNRLDIISEATRIFLSGITKATYGDLIIIFSEAYFFVTFAGEVIEGFKYLYNTQFKSKTPEFLVESLTENKLRQILLKGNAWKTHQIKQNQAEKSARRL